MEKTKRANPVWGVMTGDLVASTKSGEQLTQTFKKALSNTFKKLESPVSPPYQRFRGDSFQAIVQYPAKALQSVLAIRGQLRQAQPVDSEANWDVRIGIGIGQATIGDNATTGDGEAYRNSGLRLDELQKENRLALQTPWTSLNEEFAVHCCMLDAVVSKWSPRQAQTIVMLLNGLSREEISQKLDISQAAVHYRVKGSGWWAIKKCLERYKFCINKYLE